MRFSTFFVSAVFLSVGTATPVQKRDTDFLSVRTRTQHDTNRRDIDHPDQYFHESEFSPRYDGRFAEEPLEHDEQKKALKNLVQTYLALCSDLKVETWLMHGTLLGWWWGKKLLPWDSHIDVQVLEPDMFFLAAYHNLSIYRFKTRNFPKGRSYMLEINPHYTDREHIDKLNVADARWIDTETGVFIDITTARYNLTHPKGEGMLGNKDGYEYQDTLLFPLRPTTFEGVVAKIPYRYKEMLDSEYGQEALENTQRESYGFDDEAMEWVLENPTREYELESHGDAGSMLNPVVTLHQDGEKVLSMNERDTKEG